MADQPFPPERYAAMERFFKEVHPTLRSGEPLYNEVFAEECMFPLQRKSEMQEMLAWVRSRNPTTIMEIGADKCGGVYHWCQCIPSVRNVIACESRGTPYSDLFNTAFPNISFHWMPTSSRNPIAVARLKDWLAHNPIDVLFLDGDKIHFVQDFDAYLPLMARDGIVLMHDIVYDYVSNVCREAFDTIQSRGYKADCIINQDDWWDVTPPPKNSYEGWLLYWKGNACGVGMFDLKLPRTL